MEDQKRYLAEDSVIWDRYSWQEIAKDTCAKNIHIKMFIYSLQKIIENQKLQIWKDIWAKNIPVKYL